MSASGYDFLNFLIVACALCAAAYLVYRLCRKKKLRGYLRSLWGAPSDREYGKDEMESIKRESLFLNGEPLVDDATWNDLDMDTLYARINRSLTAAGDAAVYGALRTPDRERHERNAVGIRWMEQNPKKREAITARLYECGRTAGVNLRLLEEGDPYPRRTLPLAALLCVGLSASIALVAAGVYFAVLPLIAFAVVNVITSWRMNKKHALYAGTLGCLVSVARCAHALFRENDIPGLPGDLQTLLHKTEKVRKSGALALFYEDDSFILLFNRLFLFDTIAFAGVMKEIRRQSAALTALYRHVGWVDFALSAASWRSALPVRCEPEFAGGAPFAEFEGLVHPMLENAAPNSARLSQNALVTGSNATGKSTFLKMLALAAILAQSVNTCTAKSWRASFFRVYTSMALRDDLFGQESYFIAEIKSIKRMLDAPTDTPKLCVLDEILRGTNTGERIAASSEILLRFGGENCLCVAATHDLELSFILERAYRNLHFTEFVEDGRMRFDYKLREGRSDTRNAIKLLSLLGYDETLVERASRRFDAFVRTGTWSGAE